MIIWNKYKDVSTAEIISAPIPTYERTKSVLAAAVPIIHLLVIAIRGGTPISPREHIVNAAIVIGIVLPKPAN